MILFFELYSKKQDPILCVKKEFIESLIPCDVAQDVDNCSDISSITFLEEKNNG